MPIEAYLAFCRAIERKLPALTLAGLALGFALAWLSPSLCVAVQRAVSALLNAYAYVAPLAIFLVLAPSLARLLVCAREERGISAWRIVAWLSLQRLFAILFAVAFAGCVFRLPLFPSTGPHWQAALIKNAQSLLGMTWHSPYFYAVYAAVLTAFVAARRPGMEPLLDSGAEAIEWLGQALVPTVPLFMLAMGVYLAGQPADVLAAGLPAHLENGFVAYLKGSLLTAVACLAWHGSLLWRCKRAWPPFSLKRYIQEYWMRVYPLLWSTASESFCAPLNLHLVKKLYPSLRPAVRRFVVGIGSYLNINGTMICVIVLLALVCRMLSIPLSWEQLFLCVPLIFLIGFGVPGLPGELLLFAAPLAAMLHLDKATAAAFMALYVGFQLGLPDSFRTGANSTDSCLLAIIADEKLRASHRPASSYNKAMKKHSLFLLLALPLLAFYRTAMAGDSVQISMPQNYENENSDPYGGSGPRDAFWAMDRDGNRVITPDEWNANPDQFYALDYNRDGALNRGEFFGRGYSGGENYYAQDAFQQSDGNGDNVLSIQEWRGNTADFYNRDDNRDGVISRGEFYGQREGERRYPRRSPHLNGMDQDNDGFISLGEWRHTREEFDALDADRNSELSKDELAATSVNRF